MGTPLLQLEVRWRCAPRSLILQAVATEAYALGMTDVRKTGDWSKTTHDTQGNFRAGVATWHPLPHIAGPKAPLTPKPEVGKGRNCTGAMVGLGGKRRVTCNTLYLLASGPLHCCYFCPGCFSIRFHFLHFVQVLVQWLHHQREFSCFSWDRDQESSHTLTLILLCFHS